MRLLIDLAQDHLKLARVEAEALGATKTKQWDTFLEAQGTKRIAKRMALTKGVYEVLGSCKPENITKLVKQTKPTLGKTWKLIGRRIGNTQLKRFAKIIGDRTPSKAVMRNPETELVLVNGGSRYFFCKNIAREKQDYESRKPHKRSAPHPTGMHPRFARALVNLTGVTVKDTVIDPMCGAGGFLIEAGLMHIPFKGYDFDEEMLKRAKKNLHQFGLPGNVSKRDATKRTKPMQYVVTDLPYGKGSKKSAALEELYARFIKTLERTLVTKAVVVYPDFIDLTRYIRGSVGLRCVGLFHHYVNKLLTRIVVIIEPVK